MGNKADLFKRGIASLFIFLGLGALLLSACATPTTKEVVLEETVAPVIESLSVRPSPEKTVIEVVNSRPAEFTAFKLIDPPRVIVDIQGERSGSLQQTTQVDDENVSEIRLEAGNTQTMPTRMVVALAREVDYKVDKQDSVITLTLTPKETPQVTRASNATEAQEPQSAPAEPRIFFEPKPGSLNQVLGVDFTMLGGGRSLLVVTTDDKVDYEVNQKNKGVKLTLEDSTIPPLLMRRLDSLYFEGAVDRVKASTMDGKVVLDISLREIVTFHVNQTDAGISIEFAATVVKPPENELTPLQVSEAAPAPVLATVNTASETPANASQRVPMRTAAGAGTSTAVSGSGAGPAPKAYTGERISFTAREEEVANILRMMNVVAEINIIADPAIAGKRVSLEVVQEPWDRILDIILMLTDLAKRQIAPNILMITTGDKMRQIQAEEKRVEQEALAKIEAERQREVEEREKKKELAPMITEYIPLDFAMVGDIQQHIVLSDRGTLSTDARSNTIIIKDIAESIEEAKAVVRQFDKAVKQIQIEARIVNAESSFGRDLGVEWTTERLWQYDEGTNWGGDPTEYENNGDMVTGGVVSTNAPTGWAANLGYSLARLTNRGLGTISLDAYLAFAETEGTAQVISAPKVTASNGESATISSGTTFYLDAAENVEAKEVKAELSLEVTSTVSYNDYVTMEVTVKDETAGVARKSGKDLSTKLMVKSGDTVVIGGIYKEDTSDDESGIPVLKDIPFLGWAFKATTETVSKSELLIFITPTVLPPPDQAQGAL